MARAFLILYVCGIFAISSRPAEAQRRMGDACPDGSLVTGTVTGQAQLRQHGRVVPPEFTRSAAILAAVDDVRQRERLRRITVQRLVRQGFSIDEVDILFSLAYRDAVAGVEAARVTRGILGGAAGVVAGMAMGGDLRSALGGGALGAAGARRLAAQTIKNQMDRDIESMIDLIIRDPCRMTPAEAISRLSGS